MDLTWDPSVRILSGILQGILQKILPCILQQILKLFLTCTPVKTKLNYGCKSDSIHNRNDCHLEGFIYFFSESYCCDSGLAPNRMVRRWTLGFILHYHCSGCKYENISVMVVQRYFIQHLSFDHRFKFNVQGLL